MKYKDLPQDEQEVYLAFHVACDAVRKYMALTGKNKFTLTVYSKAPTLALIGEADGTLIEPLNKTGDYLK